MIASSLTRRRFCDPVPANVDVVVVGAGIAGISTAWFLRQAGFSVFVCEKGVVAGEQSSRNWGWIRQQGRDADELPIMIESLRIWQEFAKRLPTTGFAQHGVLYLAENQQQLAGHEQWLALAAQHQLDTRMLSGPEVDKLFNSRPGQWLGGLYTPSDARAEPFQAVPALAQMLNESGVGIAEGCAVRALEVTGGRIAGVVTESGAVRADAVVVCGGAWTRTLLANHHLEFPALTVRSSVVRTAPAALVFEGGVSAGGVALRRRQDGGYTVAASNTQDHYLSADSFRSLTRFLPVLRSSAGSVRVRLNGDLPGRLLASQRWSADEPSPFESARVLNPEPSPAALRRIRSMLMQRVPVLADVPLIQGWAGMIDVMPDVVPVMDQIADLPGLFVASGFSGHGFGIGPAAGRIMAALVAGRKPGHDLSRFRYSRFSDGTAMRPGPGF